MSNADDDKGFAAFLIDVESLANPLTVLALKYIVPIQLPREFGNLGLKWKWLSRWAYLGKLSEYIKFVARAWQAIWTPKIWMTRIDLVQNLNKNSILDGWSGLCQTVISVMISKCFYTYCDASRFLLIERDLYKDPQSIDGLSYVLFLVWNTEYGRCIEIRKSFDKSFSKDYSKHM